MAETVEYSIKITGLEEAEQTLDRLLTKAEKLRSILAETECLAENLGTTTTKSTVNSDLPQVVYNVSLGNLRDIMGAPSEAFSQSFLDEIGKAFGQIANTKIITPEQVAENKKKLAEAHIIRQKTKHN